MFTHDIVTWVWIVTFRPLTAGLHQAMMLKRYDPCNNIMRQMITKLSFQTMMNNIIHNNVYSCLISNSLHTTKDKSPSILHNDCGKGLHVISCSSESGYESTNVANILAVSSESLSWKKKTEVPKLSLLLNETLKLLGDMFLFFSGILISPILLRWPEPIYWPVGYFF